jgi:hypothetical protein
MHEAEDVERMCAVGVERGSFAERANRAPGVIGMVGDAFEQKRLGFQLVDAEAVDPSFLVLSLENCVRVASPRGIELLRCEGELVEMALADLAVFACRCIGVPYFLDVGVGELERFDRSGSIASGRWRPMGMTATMPRERYPRQPTPDRVP